MRYYRRGRREGYGVDAVDHVMFSNRDGLYNLTVTYWYFKHLFRSEFLPGMTFVSVRLRR